MLLGTSVFYCLCFIATVSFFVLFIRLTHYLLIFLSIILFLHVSKSLAVSFFITSVLFLYPTTYYTIVFLAETLFF